MRTFISSIILAAFSLAAFPQNKEPKLTIDFNQKGAKIPSSMYGVFFEEISHGGEGGLYAEMIRNRAFEDNNIPSGCTYKDGYVYAPVKPSYMTGTIKNWKTRWNISDTHPAWTLKTKGDAVAMIEVTDTAALNPNTPHSLIIDISNASDINPVSVSNGGFWGISVTQGEKYNLRLFLNSPHVYKGSVTAKIISSDGKTLAEKKLDLKNSGQWNEYQYQITALSSDNKATFDLCFNAQGTFRLDYVSLFPDKTFKNRKNGLRTDVAQTIANLKPAFIRWPGGCIVEGLTLENRVRWKETIGDPATRKGEYDLWGYRNTYGWGFYEYLQFCEDIGAAGLYVCNVGISCEFRNGDYCSEDSVKYFVQDALDAIEYAIGDVKTTWGAKRAAAGHPQPFPLKYIEIGNENYGPIYNNRRNIFYKALKSKYPKLTYITNIGFEGLGKSMEIIRKETDKNDMIDSHWYESPDWFFNNAQLFDTIKRPDYKIYVGEYACNKNVGAGNLYGALSEAAFISGMERNSDLVTMTSYAPLFENSNKRNWPVNLIWINNNQVFGRSSYYVQKMFAGNLPTINLGTTLSLPQKPITQDFSGNIGLATFRTNAQFKDIVVTSNKTEVYKSDFVNRPTDWTPVSGKWKINGDAYEQTELEPFRLALVKEKSFDNFTLKFKARKINGSEGFIIVFGSKDDKTRYSLNISGWNNSYTGFEKVENGITSTISGTVLSKIENNRWYTFTLIANYPNIECYMDSQLLIKHKVKEYYKQYAIAGYDNKTNEMIIKVVNAEATPFKPTIDLKNVTSVSPEGQLISLSSNNVTDENTFEQPQKIAPTVETFNGFSKEFSMEFKPYSFTILRVKCK